MAITPGLGLVDKLAIVQPIVVLARANVVVDERGRLEKVQHRKVVGRRLRGRAVRRGGVGGVGGGAGVGGVDVRVAVAATSS